MKKQVVKSKKASPKTKAVIGVGLGDVVEVVTRKTGIKKAVEAISKTLGIECGCEERKEILNKLFSGSRKVINCINREEYNLISETIQAAETRNAAYPAEQKIMAEQYAKIFGTKYELWCNHCPNVWNTKIKEIKKVLKAYENDFGKS